MGFKNYSPFDYFYTEKKREVGAVTRLMFEELARPFVVPASYGWSHLHMEIDNKMEDKTNKKFWTIQVTIDYRIETVNNGHKYDSEAAAIADAEKFAGLNPGREYIVMQAISRSIVTKPTITTRLG